MVVKEKEAISESGSACQKCKLIFIESFMIIIAVMSVILTQETVPVLASLVMIEWTLHIGNLKKRNLPASSCDLLQDIERIVVCNLEFL